MSRDQLIARGLELVRRNQTLNQMLDEAAARYLGVNGTDARAVDAIDQAGRIAAGDLAHALRLSTGAVTAIVDRLAKAGYARRLADPDDRRRVLIEVTAKAHRLSGDIYGEPSEAFEWAAAYTDGELAVLVRFQEQSREWLERRLAHAEQLNARKAKSPGRAKPPARTLRGRGRA